MDGFSPDAGLSNILLPEAECRLDGSWLEAGFLAEASMNMTYYKDNSEHQSCKPCAKKERNAGFQDAWVQRNKTCVSAVQWTPATQQRAEADWVSLWVSEG